MNYHHQDPEAVKFRATNRSNSEDKNKNKNKNTSSVTELIHRAVSVNNKTTKLVREHRYDAAVKSFTSVLKILKPLAVMVEGREDCDDASNEPIETDCSNGTGSTNASSASSTITSTITSTSTSTSTNTSTNTSANTSTSTSTSTTTRRRDGSVEIDHEENIETINSNPETESESESESESTLKRSQSHLMFEHPRRRSSLGSVPSRSSQQKSQRRHSATASTEISSSSSSSSSPPVSSKSTSASASASASPPQLAERRPSHFVYRDLVEIPPESVPSEIVLTDATGTSITLFSKFLMIVMYNLGLTLHLHALSIGNDDGSVDNNNIGNRNSNSNNDADADADADVNKPSSASTRDERKAMKLFSRARKLYELAFEMHLDESCDVSLLFTLALINNLGLVYNILGEKRRSQTCFKNMFSTMMYLVDTNESQAIKEWDGLISNVMEILFREEREIAAPAA